MIFRFVPCNGTFDPSDNAHLRNIERDNDLPTNSILTASWCKRPDKRSPNQSTATLKVACSSPDLANRFLTGQIRVDDHLVDVRKDIRIPIRCVKCQGYGHIQDSCISIDRCANCASEFHKADTCDRPPSCVSCSPDSRHPSTSPTCLAFLSKCDALDQRLPENAMPYFPSGESWTWAMAPSNPPPPETPLPPPQQASSSQRSLRPPPDNRHVVEKSALSVSNNLPTPNIVKRTTAGRLSVSAKRPSPVLGAANQVPPPLPPHQVCAATSPLHLHLNEYTPTRAPTETQNLAAKCSQVKNGPYLHLKHSKPQRLGYLSPPGAMD